MRPAPTMSGRSRRSGRWTATAAAALLASSGLVGCGQARVEPGVAGARPGTEWVGTWATGVDRPVSGQALAGFTDTTIRQRMHVSVGGDTMRLRLTNAFGTSPLVVGSTTLALPGGQPGDVDPSRLVPVTFSGADEVRIPVGAEVVSDPVSLDVADDSDVLVSTYLPGPTGPATYHALAQATGWTAPGDRTADASAASFPAVTRSFWFLDGLDVGASARGSVAFVGDSITDGNGSAADADHRWPDYLADRMLAGPPGRRFGVLNAGISGNRLLLDARSAGQGRNALARLERDGLTQTGVRTVFVFQGVNDIQQDPSEYDPQQLIAAYRQIARRAHDQGLRAVGATIMPFEGWGKWTPEREAVRAAVNEWVRTADDFDAVVDFDAATRDPSRPTALLPDYDSGDHLHPNDAGYAAMAGAVDLRELSP